MALRSGPIQLNWVGCLSVAVDGAGNLSSGNDNLVTVELDPQTLAFEFNQVSTWDTGFQGEVLLTNLGVDPITDWTFVFEQPALADSWGAKFSEGEEDVYHVGYPDHEPVIEPGTTIVVGYTAESLETPDTAVWRGSTCTLDGSPCVMQ